MRGRITGNVNGWPIFQGVGFAFVCFRPIGAAWHRKGTFRPLSWLDRMIGGFTHPQLNALRGLSILMSGVDSIPKNWTGSAPWDDVGSASAVVLEVLPEDRPAATHVATDPDFRAGANRFVDDSVGTREACCPGAGREDTVEFVAGEANGDDGLGWWIAITPQPVGVHTADGLGKAVGAAIEVDCASFALVDSEDSECNTFCCREGVAHARDGDSKLRPADLHVKAVVGRVSDAPPRGVYWCDGDNERAGDEAANSKRCPSGADRSGTRVLAERTQTALGPDGAGRQQHGVGGAEIVVSASRCEKENKRNHVHPAEHAEGLPSGRCE